jgi:hypothetical protein
MAPKLGILALLEAKADKSEEVATFLEQGRALAEVGGDLFAKDPDIKLVDLIAVK